VPDFVDPATDGSLPGRENAWGLINQYRARLAKQARNWTEAERLQRAVVEWARRRTALLLTEPSVLTKPSDEWDDMQRNDIRSLAGSLQNLGDIQLELNSVECAVAYLEAFDLGILILDRTLAAACAFNLGHAYKNLLVLRDLARADQWYRFSLELCSERDGRGRGACLVQLGQIAYERFQEAKEAGRSKDELLNHLNAALQFYSQALARIPPDAPDMVATTHFVIGNTYTAGGVFDRARAHYLEAIRREEAAGNLYGAAQTRGNVANTLAKAGCLVDAREYALAALHNFETFGTCAAADVQKMRSLIALIEQTLQSHGG
jgi:tetratricopeptide (TPR) repeat protein